MENGILIVVGLIIALLVLISIGIAALNLKDINRQQRTGSSDEHKTVQPPSLSNRHSSSKKNIKFGEPIDIEQNSKYPQEAYIEINSSVSKTDKCPICRNPVSENESVICPKCNSHYHHVCFTENKNVCGNCKWVKP